MKCVTCGQEIKATRKPATFTLANALEWHSWTGMIARCRNKKDPNYGGKGIGVCERWKDFANFCADMGPRPSRAHSIDRINSAGNYEPNNCRWILKSINIRRAQIER